MKQKKTTLYLIRHGATEWNKAGRYQGCTDIALSEDGLEQIKAMGKRFQYLPLDAIYTSPLGRAKETAQAITDVTGIPYEISEPFKEINFGEWEGFTIKELTEKYGDAYINFWKDPFNHPLPGEGSFQNAADRAMVGYREILEKHKGGNVAIVSHGGLLRVFLVELLHMNMDMYRGTWLTNTSITTVEIMEDGTKLLMTLNDKAHLEMGNLWQDGDKNG